MSTITIKCPTCGGNLAFDPESQKLRCPYCGSVFTQEELGVTPEDEAPAEAVEAAPADDGVAYAEYHCRNCGAEVITTETTAASLCYYCHSPVVMSDRLSGAFKPDGVIPFSHDRAEAQRLFQSFLQKKRFVDRRFFDSAQLETLSGVYYPAWYGDFEGEASFDGTGTQVSTTTRGHYIITTTRYYQVLREGTIRFRNLFRKALKKSSRELLDGIQPFDFAGMKDYTPAYLSGYLAEMRDVEADEVLPEMRREIEQYGQRMIQEKRSMNTLKGKASWQLQSEKMRYVLLPAWILTYKGAGDQIYYYMMNGQNGRTCGKLPINRGKLLATALIVGAAAAALLCAGGAFIW